MPRAFLLFNQITIITAFGGAGFGLAVCQPFAKGVARRIALGSVAIKALPR